MNQDVLWEYYQTEGIKSFAGNKPRIQFLIGKLGHAKRILNIGIGNGLFEEMAQKAGKEVFSLDPCAPAVENIKSRLSLGDRAKVGYSDNIPFGKESFDAIVASEVLEHLTDEQLTRTIPEVYRVLAPEGVFIGTVPAREELEAGLVVCPCCNARFHRWGHHQRFDACGLSEVLGKTFPVLEIYERCFWDTQTMSMKMRVEYMVKELFWKIGLHRIGDTIYFRVQKHI